MSYARKNLVSLQETPYYWPKCERGNSIPYTLRDYLTLVDWSGRAIRAGKRLHSERCATDPEAPQS